MHHLHMYAFPIEILLNFFFQFSQRCSEFFSHIGILSDRLVSTTSIELDAMSYQLFLYNTTPCVPRTILSSPVCCAGVCLSLSVSPVMEEAMLN